MKQFIHYKISKIENKNEFSLTIPADSIIRNCEIHKNIFLFLVENKVNSNSKFTKTLHYKLITINGLDNNLSTNLEYQYNFGGLIICLDKSK